MVCHNIGRVGEWLLAPAKPTFLWGENKAVPLYLNIRLWECGHKWCIMTIMFLYATDKFVNWKKRVSTFPTTLNLVNVILSVSYLIAIVFGRTIFLLRNNVLVFSLYIFSIHHATRRTKKHHDVRSRSCLMARGVALFNKCLNYQNWGQYIIYCKV